MQVSGQVEVLKWLCAFITFSSFMWIKALVGKR